MRRKHQFERQNEMVVVILKTKQQGGTVEKFQPDENDIKFEEERFVVEILKNMRNTGVDTDIPEDIRELLTKGKRLKKRHGAKYGTGTIDAYIKGIRCVMR